MTAPFGAALTLAHGSEITHRRQLTGQPVESRHGVILGYAGHQAVLLDLTHVSAEWCDDLVAAVQASRPARAS
jgi:hypothetical protein